MLTKSLSVFAFWILNKWVEACHATFIKAFPGRWIQDSCNHQTLDFAWCLDGCGKCWEQSWGRELLFQDQIAFCLKNQTLIHFWRYFPLYHKVFLLSHLTWLQLSYSYYCPLNVRLDLEKIFTMYKIHN